MWRPIFSQGLPGFDVVGLPGAAVRESRGWVRASMKNCGFTYPVSRITVNLAPADVRREGSVYDLPLFALLKASGQLREPLDDAAFVGELSLTGRFVRCGGATDSDRRAGGGAPPVFIPAGNAAEGAVVDGIEVYPVTTVAALLTHFFGRSTPAARPAGGFSRPVRRDGETADFADVKGRLPPAARWRWRPPVLTISC